MQAITASGWSAQRGAAIVFIFVAIIAALKTRVGLEKKISTPDAVATDSCRALVGAAVAIADVTIITIFACLNEGIPATSDGAEVCAGIAVVVISVIARLLPFDDPIAASHGLGFD